MPGKAGLIGDAMAYVTEYTCSGCGLELVDDGRVFVWDDEHGWTEDFLLLMMTYMTITLMNMAEIFQGSRKSVKNINTQSNGRTTTTSSGFRDMITSSIPIIYFPQ